MLNISDVKYVVGISIHTVVSRTGWMVMFGNNTPVFRHGLGKRFILLNHRVSIVLTLLNAAASE